MEMKTGKLPEAALIRSVLRQVKHRREDVLAGPAIGQDCAAFTVEPDEVVVMSADPITGTTKEIGKYSIYITVNDLAASGAVPLGVMLTVLLPEGTQEAELRKMMQEAEAVCDRLQIEILGGHTEVTRAVCQPIITVAGVGKVKRSELKTTLQLMPEQDLVVTKWIGLEGTAILAGEREAELRQRFPADLVETGKGFEQFLSVVPESRIAAGHGVSAMHDVTEGGIFGALWEMASGAGVGLEVDLKKIPIRQETVEICEYFGINPYQLMSSGSMLIGTDDGHGLVRRLEKTGIHSAVIGRTTAGKDRILRNGEEVRYLDKPQTDELYKVMG